MTATLTYTFNHIVALYVFYYSRSHKNIHLHTHIYQGSVRTHVDVGECTLNQISVLRSC